MQVPVVKAKRYTFPGIGLVKESDTFFHTDSTASPGLLSERGRGFYMEWLFNRGGLGRRRSGVAFLGNICYLCGLNGVVGRMLWYR